MKTYLSSLQLASLSHQLTCQSAVVTIQNQSQSKTGLEGVGPQFQYYNSAVCVIY